MVGMSMRDLSTGAGIAIARSVIGRGAVARGRLGIVSAF